jgi:hypothetical protein
MSREAGLFDEANGSPLRGYLLLKSRRGGNIPPNWIVRSRKSRKGREKDVATAFKKSKRTRMTTLEDWELAYRKECFYRGIRALLDLEREGETRLWAKLSGRRPDLPVTDDGPLECRLLGLAAVVDPGGDATRWRLVLYPAPDFGIVEALQDAL